MVISSRSVIRLGVFMWDFSKAQLVMKIGQHDSKWNSIVLLLSSAIFINSLG